MNNTPVKFVSRTVTARKKHTCCECQVTINPGNKYRYTKGLWPQGVGYATYKQCLRCHQLMEELNRIGRYPTYENVIEAAINADLLRKIQGSSLYALHNTVQGIISGPNHIFQSCTICSKRISPGVLRHSTRFYTPAGLLETEIVKCLTCACKGKENPRE